MNKYFITGPSKGLGKAITERLLEDENNLICGISRTVAIQHERYSHIKVDFNDTEELIKTVDSIFDLDLKYDKVVLINNAGYLGEIDHLGSLPDKDIAQAFRINIIAPAILLNTFIRYYRQFNGQKLVINISSGAAKNPYDGWSTYCSSKAAIDMLSRVAMEENVIDKGDFRIYSVAPGVIETSMQEQIRSTEKSKFSNVARFHSLKENNKLQSPEEAAEKLIRFIENAGKYSEVVQDIRDIY